MPLVFCPKVRVTRHQRGVSLVEVLIGIVIVVLASLGTLMYFSYSLGGIGRQSNRRAALERARQRLEQLIVANSSQLPPQDGQLYWCNDSNTTGAACTSWVPSATPIPQTVGPVNNLTGVPMQTSVQMIDDLSAGTATLDALEFGVKVWFVPGTTADDNFHRVYIRTLRTP